LEQNRSRLLINYSGSFNPRKTDKELHRARIDKKNNRKGKALVKEVLEDNIN
jgi:hypothetical protein